MLDSLNVSYTSVIGVIESYMKAVLGNPSLKLQAVETMVNGRYRNTIIMLT